MTMVLPGQKGLTLLDQEVVVLGSVYDVVGAGAWEQIRGFSPFSGSRSYFDFVTDAYRIPNDFPDVIVKLALQASMTNTDNTTAGAALGIGSGINDPGDSPLTVFTAMELARTQDFSLAAINCPGPYFSAGAGDFFGAWVFQETVGTIHLLPENSTWFSLEIWL